MSVSAISMAAWLILTSLDVCSCDYCTSFLLYKTCRDLLPQNLLTQNPLLCLYCLNNGQLYDGCIIIHYHKIMERNSSHENDNICFETRFWKNVWHILYKHYFASYASKHILKWNDKLYRQSFSNYKFCMLPVRFLLWISIEN